MKNIDTSILVATNVSTGNTMFLIRYILVITLLLVGLYMISVFLKKKGSSFSFTKKMKVVEKLQLSHDKNLLIIEVGEMYYLVGVTKNNMTVLDKRVDLKEIYEKVDKADGALSPSFMNIFKEKVGKNDIFNKEDGNQE